MRDEATQRLTFSGPDGWTAEDLAALLQNLYVLYNRTIILNSERASSAAGLLRLLYGSKSRVSDNDKLSIESLTIHSPIKLDLKGLGEPIEQIRGLVRDLQGGNKIELEAKKEALLHQRAMNRIAEQMAQLEVLEKAVNMADTLGSTKEEKEKIVNALFHPAEQLASVMDRKQLQLEDRESHGE